MGVPVAPIFRVQNHLQNTEQQDKIVESRSARRKGGGVNRNKIRSIYRETFLSVGQITIGACVMYFTPFRGEGLVLLAAGIASLALQKEKPKKGD